MKMKIKFIALDLDGTLLNDDGLVDNKTIKLIEELDREKYVLMFVSGRHYRDIQSVLSQFKLKKIPTIISCDGQYIYVNNEKVFIGCFLTSNNVERIMKEVNLERVEFYTEKDNYIVFEKLPSYIYYRFLFMIRRCKTIVLLKKQLLKKEIAGIEKIAFWEKEIGNKVLADELQVNYTVNRLRNGKYEIIHKSISKYRTILKARELGLIDIEETLYIGDDWNDYECFQNLPYCVAMKNAPKELIELSLFETSSNNDFGVYNALKKILY